MVTSLKAEARRGRSRGVSVVSSSLRSIDPVFNSDGFLEVLGRFRKDVDLDILPVVDASL